MDHSTFAGISLSESLLKSLQELGYEKPTPIQQQAIPTILDGKDIAGQAHTGSGKTAAYGLPVLQKIDVKLNQVQVLIIVPTRELVSQVREELKKLGKYIPGLKILSVYGGHSFAEERSSFAHPPHILIATPGRLLDHIKRETFQTHSISHLVIDEADKLLEMNFEEELNQILDKLPPTRQSLLFSATLPQPVLSLISKSLRHAQFIKADSTATPEQIEYIAYRIEPDDKLSSLLQLMAQAEEKRMVIFCNTRERVEEVAALLRRKGYAAAALHGAMNQVERDQALLKFRNASAPVLVATDLVARGIHIAELGTVIHLEILRGEAIFLHRSGRTGRMGNAGTVHVFLSEEEEKYIQHWKQIKDFEWKTLKTTRQSGSKAVSPPATPENITLHIKAGRKEKISPGDIVGAILAETGLQAQQIGKIEVHDHVSYVAIPFLSAKAVVEKLNEVKIKGRKFRVSIVK
jgi:ATP-independent RNA helicase DbpA